MNQDTPTGVIRWLFYAFVLSLPFETVSEGVVEPTTVLGALLVLSALLQPSLFLRWPPKGFWCFIVYLYVFAALSLLEPSVYRQATLLNVFLLAQLTVLGWIGFCLMRDRQTAERAFLTFAGGCVFLSLLQVTGLAGRAAETDVTEVVRITAFGFHPNNLARILMLGMLALVGLTLVKSKSLIRSLLLVGPLVLLLGVAMVQTGSRGGLIALGAAGMTLILRRGSMVMKVLNGLGLTLLMGVLFIAVLQSDIMRTRFEETIEDGDVARRDKIYPTAFEMFTEKPLLGWGPINSTFELGMRLGHPEEETKNPHNVILFGLVTTGLLGSLPLFVGLAFCGLSAWKTRTGPHGVLPLAMFVAVMVANMSGLWLFNKLHWLVMAYALASLYHVALETDQSVETSEQTDFEERELVTI
ncbi:MAG TPA: O-antigen ligase family protein [Pyrinomonadaceae bacterium]|nr:O-antigen ligase family protein [Pyrinomonadaceae bacterium]